MKEYSFANTTVLVNGVELSGYDEGDDVIKAVRAKQSGSHKVGVDGEMTVSFTSDKSGIVTVRLMQSSDSNSFLSAIVSASENGSFVPIALLFKNTATGETFGGSQGYIQKHPDMSRGENANNMAVSYTHLTLPTKA